MFTGIIEETGILRSIHREAGYARLEIEACLVLTQTIPGDSIAVNGVCQTVTQLGNRRFWVETLAVSLEKTTLGDLRSGAVVNLERALTPNTRLGGHIVQGHVDGTAETVSVEMTNRNVYLKLKLPAQLSRYCLDEGSIAVDGVSLTISSYSDNVIGINIIPVTWEKTALKGRKTGDKVNIEVDIVGRYVERLLAAYTDKSRFGQAEQRALSAGKLISLGF